MNSKPATAEKKTLTTLDGDYFKDKRRLGLETLTADDLPTPTINLIQSNSTLVDQDNRPLPRGQFFYKGTGEVMREVNCTMLVLDKKEMPDFSDKDVMVKTYVFLGVMNDTYQPFLLYLKRTGIGAAKDFLGKVRAMQVPMFAVNVTLLADKIDGEKGSYYKIRFQVNGLHENNETILKLEDLVNKYKPEVQDEDGEVNPSDIPF